MKFLIINGPNLNMLGKRESGHYGSCSLEEIKTYTNQNCPSEVSLDWWQSNSEEKIIEKIHELEQSDYQALIINPAAFSHTSIAIMDALRIIKIPIIEVHLSNVHSREEFRQTLLTAKAASIIMGGLKKDAYLFGVNAALSLLKG